MRVNPLFQSVFAIACVLLTHQIFAQGGASCASAVAVTAGAQTATGPAGTPEGGCFAGATASEWFSYTPAAADQLVTISSCFGGADTRLSVYDGSCGALMCVVSNDDFCDYGPGFLYASEVTFCASFGTTYFIEWDDYWSNAGFSWTLSETPQSCSLPPDCPTLIEPLNLATDQVLSPLLIWSPAATGGVPDSFEIFFGTTSGALVSLGSVPGNDTAQFIINLAFSTPYFWSIVPFNVNGAATGCTEFGFTTIPAPPTRVGVTCTSGGAPGFVFTEDFDTAPNGWTGDINGGDGSWIFPQSGPTLSTNTGPSAAGNGANYVYYEASGGVTTTASLISPAIDLTSVSDQVELSFLMHAFGLGIGPFEVGVGTSAAGPFTNLYAYPGGQIQTATTDPWLEVGIDLTSSIGSTVFIEFKQTGINNFDGDMSLDFVRVETCLSCETPVVNSAVIDPICPAGGFNVLVDVASFESGTSPMFTDGFMFWPVVLGSNTVGPFGNGDTVTLSIVHGVDPTCDLPLGMFSFGCPPDNDDCTNATTVVCDDMLVGETTNFSSGGSGTSCDGTIGDGVWYTFIGTGDLVSFTASPDAGSWSPQVDVYDSPDGTCGSIVCNTANSTFSGIPVTVSFLSVLNEVYYINVGPSINGEPGGDFDLDVACNCPGPPVFTAVADFSVCPAVSVDVEITSVGTYNVTNNLNGSVHLGVGVGIYSLIGFTSGDVVTVYVTDASDPTCLDSIILNLTCPPDNDLCAGAEVIVAMTPGIYPVSGSTTFATLDDAPAACNGFDLNTSPGVWYELQTDNQYDLVITTCDVGTAFDTRIGVFTGVCPTPTCLTADDDDASCATNTLATTIMLTAGSYVTGGSPGGISNHSPVNLFIYVTGFGTNTGDFNLIVEVLQPLPAELLQIKAKAEGRTNMIEWQTASELNTASHVVERSHDGLTNWSDIGFVDAAGNSSDIKSYALRDQKPLLTSFYRLRTVDFDGSRDYSAIVSVVRTEASGDSVYTISIPCPRAII